MSKAITGLGLVGGLALGVYLIMDSKKIHTIAGTSETDPKKTFKEWADQFGAEYGLDTYLLLGIMRVESGLNPKIISKLNTNGTRDYGLMQINNNGFVELGVDAESVMRVPVNIDCACRLLVQKRKYITAHLGKCSDDQLISAYNQGEGNVVKIGIRNRGYVTNVQFWRNTYWAIGGRIAAPGGITRV